MRRAKRRTPNRGAGWLTIALMLFLAPRLPAQDWQTFKSPSDGFSILFPAEPRQDSRDIDTEAGTVELRSYTIDLDEVALFVGVCDYGTKAEGSDSDAMLEEAKKGALANSKAQLTRDSKILLNGYRGIEFESEGEGGRHYIARMYMVGTKMYQTLVVYPSASPYADAARFLNSFQLIGKQ